MSYIRRLLSRASNQGVRLKIMAIIKLPTQSYRTPPVSSRQTNEEKNSQVVSLSERLPTALVEPLATL